VESSGEKNSKHFEGKRVVTSEDGWITPTGIFYACTSEEHDDSAGYLLKAHRANIEHRLKEDHQYQILENIDDLPPRSVLKTVGFALLSKGLLVESNLPSSVSRKQLELMQRSNLKFAPESGKLDPEIYLEYGRQLRQNPQVALLLESQSHETRQAIEAFVDNPSSLLMLSDAYDQDLDIKKVYDTLTAGHTKELVRGEAINHGDQFTWRKVTLPSNSAVYIQLDDHEHDAYADYRGDHDYAISLVSKQAVQRFLQTEDIPQLD
jgi:hypothetical protein